MTPRIRTQQGGSPRPQNTKRPPSPNAVNDNADPAPAAPAALKHDRFRLLNLKRDESNAKPLRIKRGILYAFPIYLTLAEYAMRSLMSFAKGNHELVSILAASNGIAVAGISLITPVLLPKSAAAKLSPATLAALAAARQKPANPKDQMLILAGWIALLLLPFPWGWLLWLTHNYDHSLDLPLGHLAVPGPCLIASFIYVIGIGYTALKEIV